MHLLINQMLMLRIFRIHNLHRLPPPLSLASIPHLKHSRSNQHRDGQTLRVDPSLHQFLLRAQVRTSTDDSEGYAHGEYPADANNWVAVLFTPVHEALVGGFLGLLFRADAFGFVFVAFFGVLGGFKGARVAVRCYDCCGRKGR